MSVCRSVFSGRFVSRALILATVAALVLPAACTSDPPPPAGSADDARQPLYWYDPMRPEVHFNAPGRSPFMDMALVPMYADQAAATAGIAVSAEVAQTLGVRTGLVVRDTVQPVLGTTAEARVAGDRRWMLYSRAPGWIEGLHVHAVGETVRAGQVVAEIYSPELAQAQEELLLSPAAAAAATERLRRLGIADEDIEAVRAAGKARRALPLRAPVSGAVLVLAVHPGARVTPDQALLEIGPDNTLWLEARLFPGQSEWLGRPVEARFRRPGQPGFEWQGGPGYLYPEADPVSQTQRMRFVLAESTRRLPPGVWLEAELRGPAREQVLLVPVEAVIRTGDGDRVITTLPGGRFGTAGVRLGARYGERFEILAGLSEGDRVVISGQFLLDSETELQGGLRRLSTAGPAPADDARAPESGHVH